MSKKWSVVKNDDEIFVIEDANGIYETKEQAIRAGQDNAIEDKTILKIGDEESVNFEITDYTNALTIDEWSAKTKSEIKIAKAEYMITKTRERDVKQALRQAKVEHNYEKEMQLKVRLNETLLRKRTTEMNYRKAKLRLKESKQSARKKK